MSYTKANNCEIIDSIFNLLDGRRASSAAITGKARNPRSCLSRNAAPRYRRPASPAWSNATAADLGIKAHAHMLRHACGYKLAKDGHDTRAIQA